MANATTNISSLKSGSKFGDLRRRLIFLVLALIVYRIGTHIPVPGIDPDQLAELFNSQSSGILVCSICSQVAHYQDSQCLL